VQLALDLIWERILPRLEPRDSTLRDKIFFIIEKKPEKI
jgi:hypothetical protein